MDAAEIMRCSGEMRRGNREYLSNAFFALPQLEEYLKTGRVTVCQAEGLIVLLEEKPALYHVQYFARNAAALSFLPDLLPTTEKPIVADVVGRKEAAEAAAEQLKPLGFVPYSTFARMICKEPVLPRADGEERVELATEQDVPAIEAALRDQFDPLSEHLPEQAEILAAVHRQEITVIREKEGLLGITWFERVSEKYVNLRYVVVNANHRGENIGGALLHHEFTHAKPGTVYMLWVCTCNNACTFHQKFNFRYDGLTDCILKFGGK